MGGGGVAPCDRSCAPHRERPHWRPGRRRGRQGPLDVGVLKTRTWPVRSGSTPALCWGSREHRGACGCEAAESHLEHSSRGPSGSRKVRVQAEVDGRARLFFRTWQQVSDGQPRVPRPVRCKISFGGDTKRCKNCSSYPEENLRNAY